MKKNETKNLAPNYKLYRQDILEQLIDERGIECKYKPSEMIKYLEMDDRKEYVRSTTQEKEDGGYLIGIDLRNGKDLSFIGRIVERKEARRLNRYAYGRIYYWSKTKIIND
jgi:hypothetical protein